MSATTQIYDVYCILSTFVVLFSDPLPHPRVFWALPIVPTRTASGTPSQKPSAQRAEEHGDVAAPAEAHHPDDAAGEEQRLRPRSGPVGPVGAN